MQENRSIKKISFFLLCLGILTFLLLSSTSYVFAAPVRPVEVTLTQPDGSQFQAMPWGDEWVDGMETAEGYTILLSPVSDFWIYAQPTLDGLMAPGLAGEPELVVGRDEPTGLPKHLRPQEALDGLSSPAFRSQSLAETGQTPNTGTHQLLVILVEFLDTKGQTSPAHWHDKIFGSTNSVRQFFADASFNTMSLSPASETHGTKNDGIVGWLSLPYNHPNTRGNISASSQSIARDAIQAAAPFVNFGDFDTNQDGVISFDELHIMIVVAGNETAYGGSASTCPPSIWAHAWGFNHNPPLVDGVRIGLTRAGGGYTQVGEWHCEISDRPGHPATIGILTHELGHELGWPDLYDISGQSAGLGYWDVMSHGLWNKSETDAPDGNSPALPNPWSRWHQGWFEPQQIKRSQVNVNIPAIQTSGVAFQFLDNPNGVDWVFNLHSGTGEYFLVENRQLMGFDVGLPGAGILIWHIDEGAPFSNNANSNPDRRLVDLIQADGLRQLNISRGGNRGDGGDPYPGNAQNRIFNASSIPNSRLNNGSLSGVSITGISDNHALMRANFFVRSFFDVGLDNWAWAAVEGLAASGITQGCEIGFYCPENTTTRAEMAVFLMRSLKGGDYTPDPAVGLFEDVPLTYWAVDWIEALYDTEITIGCDQNPLRYCPSQSVSRAEMAVFLLRSKYGPNHTPPPAQGIFQDVPIDHWAAPWIEQLYQEALTTGCSEEPLRFCPAGSLTRAEMATFLVRTFDLPLP